jgi:hypothetical protein
MTSALSPKRQRSGKLGGWILFVGCLLLLSLGAGAFHKAADIALISIRLSLVIILSILILRERWSHRHDLLSGRGRPYNLGESILQRCRRWYYDEDR